MQKCSAISTTIETYGRIH